MYAEKLKAHMEREGITIYRVAKDMGITWVTARSWIEGKHKPRGIYKKVLEEYLGEKA